MAARLRERAGERQTPPDRDFEAFFDVERPRLFRALVLVTGDVHQAEDLLQDAFSRVWERWDRVSGMDNPAGYLHRTAMNRFRTGYRHALMAARRRMHVARDQPDPFAEIEAREEAVRALRALTRRQRAAVVLTELLGYPVAEAAAILSIRPGTVRVLVSQARATLARRGGPGDD
jgi:RNA polymerase sigma factor (sigma-70 family)